MKTNGIDWRALSLQMWSSCADLPARPDFRRGLTRRRTRVLILPLPLMAIYAFCVMTVAFAWVGVMALLLGARFLAALALSFAWGISNLVPSRESRTRVDTQLGR